MKNSHFDTTKHAFREENLLSEMRKNNMKKTKIVKKKQEEKPTLSLDADLII